MEDFVLRSEPPINSIFGAPLFAFYFSRVWKGGRVETDVRERAEWRGRDQFFTAGCICSGEIQKTGVVAPGLLFDRKMSLPMPKICILTLTVPAENTEDTRTRTRGVKFRLFQHTFVSVIF